jgi:hypothetical protein
MGQPSFRWARDSQLSDVRKVRFCTVPTGARIAYASAGSGPALLVPAAWISHLELLWQDPAYRAFFAPLAGARTVVQYDRPGCGLSEPWPGPQDLDTDLAVLEAVVDELGLERDHRADAERRRTRACGRHRHVPHVGECRYCRTPGSPRSVLLTARPVGVCEAIPARRSGDGAG